MNKERRKNGKEEETTFLIIDVQSVSNTDTAETVLGSKLLITHVLSNQQTLTSIPMDEVVDFAH